MMAIQPRTIRTIENHPCRSTRMATTIIHPWTEEELRIHMKRALDDGIVVVLKEIGDDWITMGCISSDLWIAQDPENTCFARLPGADNTSLF